MREIKISVIVPVYNKAPFIERSIRSILNQTFGDFELLIVDDGSTDHSMSIAEQFRDPRMQIIRQVNRGPGPARNTGIAASKGPICAFLDADDEWLPHYLQESYEALSQDQSVAAIASGYIECPRGISTEKMWRKRGISDGVVRLKAEHSPTHLITLLAYMSCWSTVARKQTIVAWGGFYDRDRCLYGEDSFLWLKVLLNERVLFNTKPGVKFHREASALSNTRTTARPVEPFLQHPELIYSACPEHLRELLGQFLAIRACKTSCVLTYWGDWRAGRSLFSRFARPKYWQLPFFTPALLLTNPLAASIAWAIRNVPIRLDRD